jgi:hypothetical protein
MKERREMRIRFLSFLGTPEYGPISGTFARCELGRRDGSACGGFGETVSELAQPTLLRTFVVVLVLVLVLVLDFSDET